MPEVTQRGKREDVLDLGSLEKKCGEGLRERGRLA